jgi:hypothetical protein
MVITSTEATAVLNGLITAHPITSRKLTNQLGLSYKLRVA